jgi:hypothetical protein
VTDKATAPKRISAFLKLCAAFVPCEHIEYDDTVEELDAEVGDDLDDAKFALKRVEEKVLPALVKLECEATSVLLQVLYALHRGNVQFLMADYKSRIIDAYPNAFARVRPPRLGKDGQPLKITNVGITDNSSDSLVDMASAELDEGTTSEIDYNEGEESEANTFASPPHRRSCDPRRRRRQHPLKPSKRLASAPTPRRVRTRATMTNWTKPRTVRSTSFRERLGLSEPPERRG